MTRLDSLPEGRKPPGPARAVLTVLGCTLLAALVTAVCARWTTTGWARLVEPTLVDPADLLLVGLAAAATALAAWLGLGLAVAVVAELPGAAGRAATAAASHVAPVMVRRMAALLVGTALSAAAGPVSAVALPGSGGSTVVATAAGSAGSVAPIAGSFADGPATASGPATPSSGSGRPYVGPTLAAPSPADGQEPVAPALDPAFRPLPSSSPNTRPITLDGLGPLDRIPRPESGSIGAAYVVRRGDTLWGLAAAQLGAAASPAQIAGHWPTWYAANRHVIGPDPAHIEPGQVLAVPPVEVPR